MNIRLEQGKPRRGSELERYTNYIDRKGMELCQRRWDEDEYKVTYRFITSVSFIDKARRAWFKHGYAVTVFLTGHGLNYKLAYHNSEPDPRCRMCGVDEGSWHVLFECPLYEEAREELARTVDSSDIEDTIPFRLIPTQRRYNAFATFAEKMVVARREYTRNHPLQEGN